MSMLWSCAHNRAICSQEHFIYLFLLASPKMVDVKRRAKQKEKKKSLIWRGFARISFLGTKLNVKSFRNSLWPAERYISQLLKCEHFEDSDLNWQQDGSWESLKILNFVLYAHAIITYSQSFDFYTFYIYDCYSLFCTREMLMLVISKGLWGTLAFREPNTLIPIWLAWSQFQSH